MTDFLSSSSNVKSVGKAVRIRGAGRLLRIQLFYFFLFVLLSFLLPAVSSSLEDEFVGPLSSWRDLQRDYGAVGDGKAGDTSVLQEALNNFFRHEKQFVLYLPSGVRAAKVWLPEKTAGNVTDVRIHRDMAIGGIDSIFESGRKGRALKLYAPSSRHSNLSSSPSLWRTYLLCSWPVCSSCRSRARGPCFYHQC